MTLYARPLSGSPHPHRPRITYLFHHNMAQIPFRTSLPSSAVLPAVLPAVVPAQHSFPSSNKAAKLLQPPAWKPCLLRSRSATGPPASGGGSEDFPGTSDNKLPFLHLLGDPPLPHPNGAPGGSPDVPWLPCFWKALLANYLPQGPSGKPFCFSLVCPFRAAGLLPAI